VPNNVVGSTVGAGDNKRGTCSFGGGAEDYTYSFTAPSDGDYVFDTTGSTFDALVYAYDFCGAAVEIACGQPAMVLSMTAGQLAIVSVDGNDAFSGGDFELNVSALELYETVCDDGLDGDLDGVVDCFDGDCSLAANCLPVCPDVVMAGSSATGATVFAPSEFRGSCDFNAHQNGIDSPDQSLEFTAPADGRYAFVLDPAGTTFPTQLYVLDSCGGAELGCADNFFGNGGEGVVVELLAGETAIAIVDGTGGTFGDYALEVVPAVDTQTCASALDDDGDGAAGCLDRDCIFDPACIEDCGNGFDDDLDFAFDCADLRCANDPACPEQCGNGADDDFDGFLDCQDIGCDLDAACTEDCANGVNDDGDQAIDCTDAFCAGDPACASTCPEQVLGGASFIGTLEGASDDNDGCVDNPQTPDVTHEFTAPAAGSYTFDTVGSNFDTVLYVLDSCSGQELACDDDVILGVVRTSEVTVDLAANQTVIVVVDAFSQSQLYYAGYNFTWDYVLNVQ
jgi:hypothetical protein